MLHRLAVRNFKSLHHVEVELPQLAVLFGPNAAGKSNFFEAIQALSRIASAHTLHEALNVQYPVRGYAFEAFPFDRAGLPAQLARETDIFTLEADLDTAGGNYRYRIAPQINYRTGELTVADEYLAPLGTSGNPKGVPVIEPVDSTLRIRRKGQPAHPREEKIGLNHAILSDRRLSGKGYVWLDRTREALANWCTYYFEPRLLMRQEQGPTAVPDVGIHGESLASFLYHLRGVGPKRFDAICRRVRRIVPSIESVEVNLNPQRGTLDLSVQQGGVTCSSRVVSEGALRVLALCAVAFNPWGGTVLTLEEPENGVHPRRLQLIAELLLGLSATRQVIVSTHSPLLVDAIIREQRNSETPHGIGLFNVRLTEAGTVIEPFQLPNALLGDSELVAALADRGEDGVFEGLVLRGLVDE